MVWIKVLIWTNARYRTKNLLRILTAEDDVIPFREESSADECYYSLRYSRTWKNIIPAPNNKITSQMFYSLAPSKGLNPRKFCSWDPRSGIFYWWNPESWALESRIQTKKSKIPLTTDTQFHLPRLESGTWNPECKVCNPEPRTVLDSHKWGKQMKGGQTYTWGKQTHTWGEQSKCRIKTFPLKFNR